MDASLRLALARDLAASVLQDVEIARVSCIVDGQRAVSDPIRGQAKSLDDGAIHAAAADLGCGDRGATVYHTHPHVPDLILSKEDVQAVTHNPWIAKLCTVAQDGIGCWSRQNLNLNK
jgi:hypothetical protein